MVAISKPIVQVKALRYRYPEQVVFKDFSWHTDSFLTLLLGPSGCGKTTLLRIMAGHLESDLPRLATRVALVLQDDALLPWLTAKQNLELVPERHRAKELPPALIQLREQVELYMDKYVAHLSFGQRRLLELYRVLSSSVPYIFLDEPLNFLDQEKRQAVISSIVALAASGKPIVMSTHYAADFDGIECSRFVFGKDMPHRYLNPIK